MTQKRQTAPDQGAAATNRNTNCRQSSKRERPFPQHENRRIAVGLVAVDRGLKCFRAECNCDCKETLEAIIARHGGPGEAA